ncbi:MAG TPA: hypothetical protein VIK50_10655 [Gemmatimonadaceae bacterium]
MRQFKHRAASVALGTLATLGLAACGATEVASSGDDRVIPTVSISIESAFGPAGFDTVSVRTPLQVRIQASDNAALYYAVTRIFADTMLIKVDSVALGGSRELDKVIDISLAGVRSGQQVVVQTTVSDGAGNGAVAQAFATAFDPNVPRVVFLNPGSTVFAGGTYSFNLSVSDSIGVAKVGFRATGAGLNRADSTIFAEPLPAADTVNYLIAVASSATIGATFTVTPFAENREGLRASGETITVRIVAAGVDAAPPLVYQTVPPRLETPDSIDIFARDTDGFVHVIGFVAKDQAGVVQHRRADTLAVPIQQVSRRMAFNAPTSLRGRSLFITAYAIDVAGHSGYAVPTGASVPVSADTLGKRDAIVYAYGLTYALPPNSLGADIAVDSVRRTVFVSNINRNQLEAWTYSTTLSPLPPVSVGAMPWGMTIDNSGSLLLVANSGGTNVSKVNLLQRREDGRIKTANEYVFDVTYSVDPSSGDFKYSVSPPIDYSDRPQYIAQSASGALYYSTRPTNTATPGTLRRIDNFLDERTEPRQIWQYASFQAGKFVVINSDAVSVLKGANGAPDIITICDHTPGDNPSTATCFSGNKVPDIIALLQAAPINGNVVAVRDISVESLALPDTNFVAAGGDRRRIAFGEAHTGGRAGRVLALYDPTGTPAGQEQYSAPIEVADLTNNASDQVFGLAINGNSTNIGVHGVETFFADSSLRLQGKFATFNTGAGIAFHPLNIEELTPDSLARVVFVASGDFSIQIVDSYSYRLRGRIPLRTNLYGPLRAALPTPAELASDGSLVVKLFGLTPEGIVVIDVRRGDIDNARTP